MFMERKPQFVKEYIQTIPVQEVIFHIKITGFITPTEGNLFHNVLKIYVLGLNV